MAQSDATSAVAGTREESATHKPQPGNYDHLPDLSADISMEADNAARPTFDQLNATLISRGYLRSPLNIAGMRQDSIAALSDAFHAMIAQREEDIEVRTALTAKNRILTASLERTKRFQKEELERSADFERKAEASKAKLVHLTAQLETERNAHKATKEALRRMRSDLQAVKASALQYKAANDRSVARVRARIGEVTSSAIRSAVPDFQIVASAFDDPPTASSSKAGAAGLYAQQIQELEQKRAHLVEYNQALKRFATEAINAARRADQELVDMVEAEEEESKKKHSHSVVKSNGDNGGSRSVSSSSSSGLGALKRSSPSEAWLDGHRPLFQRDLFPANDTLRSTPSGVLVSGSSTKTQHPALRALELTTTAISSHVQSLLDLRTERTVNEDALSQRLSAELREIAWTAKLEQEIHEDLRNDARLSLNKSNGPTHVGSLASAAIAASSGSSGGGASHRVDWHREKVELEKKLAQLVKQIAVAEEAAARREREVRKLAEAEHRARMQLDQASLSATPEREADATQSSEAQQQLESLKEALQTAEEKRAHIAERCKTLEAEARDLRNERDSILASRARNQAESESFATRMTSLKRLDESEVAEIHARDEKRRSDLGSLSVVAEDVEIPSLISTDETVDTLSDDLPETMDVSTSRRSARKSRSNKEGADAGAVSFGESLGNNPELDAIFGIGKSSSTKLERRSEAAPRRSSRLSGGGTVAEPVSADVEEPNLQLQKETRKRKAEQEEVQASEEKQGGLSDPGQRRSSRRISDGASNQTMEEARSSPRTGKRARAEQQSSAAEITASEPDAAVKSTRNVRTTALDGAQSHRRLSTREKQEMEQRQKRRTVSTSAAAPSKTPALSSRRVVSSSSSVTRPTAASLRRYEAAQAQRPLSNATNTRLSLAQTPASSKTQPRKVSSGSNRTRA